MARESKPFFWKQRNGWYSSIKGKRYLLAKGLENKTQAELEFHKLIVRQSQIVPETSQGLSTTLESLCGHYFKWLKENKSPSTLESYRGRLEKFLEFNPGLTVEELKPHHVDAWVNSRPNSSTSKKIEITVVKRLLKWANDDMGLIATNPIAKMPRPSANTRDTILTPEEFDNLLSFVKDENLRNLLVAVWQTGCRPFEATRLEARHYKNGKWIYPKAESKGRKKERVIALTEEVETLTRELVERFPKGKLFRNQNNIGWTRNSVACCFSRLRLVMAKANLQEQGIDCNELSKNEILKQSETSQYCLYNLRHSFCNRMLIAGLDCTVVAELMGHSSIKQVYDTYQHLQKSGNHLQDKLRNAN